MNRTEHLQLLARLWLHEPDAATLAQVRNMGAITAPLQMEVLPSELAAAYADLFLLNVYPYGTAYTDEWGELSTAEAQRAADLYAQYHFQPAELREVGAPDHLGLCLGFLGHLLSLSPDLTLSAGQSTVGTWLSELLSWAPVCCLAAERDPGVHPFYRALAALTRERLLSAEWPIAAADPSRSPLPLAQRESGDELSLRDVVRFLLAPARCGIFVSRARLGTIANTLGMRLPFGSRFEVCEWLFASAGESEQVGALLQALRSESEAWSSAYRHWAEQYRAWQGLSAPWLARVANMQRMLSAMQKLADGPLENQYQTSVAESRG